jgi:hypothetical protein
VKRLLPILALVALAVPVRGAGRNSGVNPEQHDPVELDAPPTPDLRTALMTA